MEYFFCFLFLIPSINRISYFELNAYKKKREIVVGKVIVAKAIGILILYIGRMRVVITKLGNGKRITERKEIN